MLPYPYNSWEASRRSDLLITYDIFFKRNKMTNITYDDFVIYCYKHTSHGF